MYKTQTQSLFPSGTEHVAKSIAALLLLCLGCRSGHELWAPALASPPTAAGAGEEPATLELAATRLDLGGRGRS